MQIGLVHFRANLAAIEPVPYMSSPNGNIYRQADDTFNGNPPTGSQKKTKWPLSRDVLGVKSTFASVQFTVGGRVARLSS